jgi:hypothetical protein
VTAVAPEAIDEEFVPTGRTDVGVVEVDGETVVLSETGDLHRLNQTAGVIWACCDGSGSLAELIDDLSEAYQVERSVIAPDVVSIVREFGRSGLLVGVERPVDQPEPEAPAVPTSNGDEACPEPTETEPVDADAPVPRYLVIPPNT